MKKHVKLNIAEELLNNELIIKEDYDDLIRRHKKVGGPLIRNIVKFGFISENDMASFIKKNYNINTVNLHKNIIPIDILSILKYKFVCKFQAIPLRKKNGLLLVGMLDPVNSNYIAEIENETRMKVQPFLLTANQWEEALAYFETNGYGLADYNPSGTVTPHTEYDIENILDDILLYSARENASDIFITPGVPPSIRVEGFLKRFPCLRITPEKSERFAYELMTPAEQRIFEENNEIDFAYTIPNKARFRVNIYRQRGTISIALRSLPETVPEMDTLGLPGLLKEFCFKPQGLIVVTGPSGHGKSTTLSCLLEIINRERRGNIVTIEDPIEYQHYHAQCNVNQREVGKDTQSFAKALRLVFRQSPDVIMISEMRDLESIEIALRAAMTGHLVLTTLHTLNATAGVRRLVEVFPTNDQNQIRQLLADSLQIIFAQRLIKGKQGGGLKLAYEYMINSHRIKNAIRKDNLHMLRGQAQAKMDDLTLMDNSIADLVNRKMISKKDALHHVEDENFFNSLIK